MNKSRKTSAVLFACIFVILGMWMMLSVYCQAAETHKDEKQPQTIRVGSFEDTFNYVDKNGVRQGYGYELMQALAGYNFTLAYNQSLTGEEKSWLEEHGSIRIGFLNNDPAIFSMDEETGKLNGMLAEYISYAKDCLGNQRLKFGIQEYDDYNEMLRALQDHEIDMIFYVGRNPDLAEKKGYTLTNTAWTYSLMAVTDEKYFNENEAYSVAVVKEHEALKQHIAFSYPNWKLIDCDSLADATDMVLHQKADCFLMGTSQALKYDNNRDFKSIPLTKTMEACFAVRGGEGTLLSILNKTLKTMPSDMLTSTLAIYDSTADKVTFYDFVKDNMLAFFATAGFFGLSIIAIILVFLRKARKAEAAAKLAANDTQKLNDKLEIALKKAEDASLAKTRFLNNMSHDIRTPMNVILGYAQLMEDELKGKDMPETSEHLEKLKQSGNLLLSIINNVLDMAKIESGKMEINENYGRLGAIRQSLFEIFEDEAKKKNLALHYTINVEHEHILTDTTKVKEIFVNILGNAIKYTPPGGSVIMSVDELPCNEPGYIIVRNRVSDTGIGMSEDFLTEIFEAFTREQNTTKSKIAGTGLGMSIVKKYVDLLGGTIEVESELGKGSTFTVTLKHKIADESYYVKKHLEESGISREILKDRSILLAEDNDLNAEIAAVILERAGLKVERVEDGLQCISRITEMPAGTYDIILMDIQMPKMDGYKATQTIRNLSDQEKACIPIIAMTANAFEEDKRAAIAAGMNGHIAKPIQVDKLLSILAEMIRQQEN